MSTPVPDEGVWPDPPDDARAALLDWLGHGDCDAIRNERWAVVATRNAALERAEKAEAELAKHTDCAHESETGFRGGAGRHVMVCEACFRVTDEWWDKAERDETYEVDGEVG